MATNLWCFSDEGQGNPEKVKFSAPALMQPSQHLNKCYGWISINSKNLPRGILIDHQSYYYAIVYDLVPSTKMDIDPKIIQDQLDFIYQSGLHLETVQLSNWRQSKLVDFGDLRAPWEYRPKLLGVRRSHLNGELVKMFLLRQMFPLGRLDTTANNEENEKEKERKEEEKEEQEEE